ncbi:type II toxin-antitoxin system Phd/YefM family antitoxin [Paramicrobacterium humi]|uniref:type II toxin-antitoxin system Phd/YefM family antitoxin n=1 Tax=Paramicrobacterium humi TaxID=640635 RepID=UPI000B878C16
MSLPARPEAHISLGQLRQNPTEMVRNVRDGDEYVLTDHGRPVARIVPIAPDPWVSRAAAMVAFRHPADSTWSSELNEERAASDLSDPFVQ